MQMVILNFQFMTLSVGSFCYVILGLYGLYSVFISQRLSGFTAGAAFYHAIISTYYALYLVLITYNGTVLNTEVMSSLNFAGKKKLNAFTNLNVFFFYRFIQGRLTTSIISKAIDKTRDCSTKREVILFKSNSIFFLSIRLIIVYHNFSF